MRVLLVAPQPFYRDRGTPIAVRQVLEALSELGHRVDLLTFPMGETIELPGLEILRVGSSLPVNEVPIGFSSGKVLLDLSLTNAIRSYLKRRHYSVVHAVEEAAFPATVLARRRRVPLIYDMQSSLPEQLESHPWLGRARLQRRLKAAEAWLLRRSDVIACSAGLKGHVTSIVPQAEVHEWWFNPQSPDVEPAAAVALRAELGIPPTAKVVLYTGNFAPYQGVPLLLEAALRVNRASPETVFVLVGGRREEALASSAEIAELEKVAAVRIVGRQPRERIPLYVAAADILVSPRQHGENLPLKIFDYLQAGKPIVATDTPTHRTVLDDDRAVLANMSAQDLAASITMSLQDDAVATRLGASARRWADENLGWKSFKDRVARLYHLAVHRAPTNS